MNAGIILFPRPVEDTPLKAYSIRLLGSFSMGPNVTNAAAIGEVDQQNLQASVKRALLLGDANLFLRVRRSIATLAPPILGRS